MPKKPVRPGPLNRSPKASGASTSARSTVSGPSRGPKQVASADALIAKAAGTDQLAAAMPFNPNKPGEYGKAALKPARGATVEAPNRESPAAR